MDLEKLHMGQRAHDKTGLEFVEAKSPPVSKNTKSQKEKGKKISKII
jgi:hypothetical protein